MCVSFRLKMTFSRLPHCTTGLLEVFLPKTNHGQGASPSAGAVSGFENAKQKVCFVVVIVGHCSIVVLIVGGSHAHQHTSSCK